MADRRETQPTRTHMCSDTSTCNQCERRQQVISARVVFRLRANRLAGNHVLQAQIAIARVRRELYTCE